MLRDVVFGLKSVGLWRHNVIDVDFGCGARLIAQDGLVAKELTQIIVLIHRRSFVAWTSVFSVLAF